VCRLPGSAFNTVLYAAALESFVRPSDALDGPHGTGEGWALVNFNERSNDLMSMSEVFGLSVNLAVVRLQERIVRSRVVDVSWRLGFTSELKLVHPLALGSMEVGDLDFTAIYVPLVNQGVASERFVIVAAQTLDGSRLYCHVPIKGVRALHCHDRIAQGRRRHSDRSTGRDTRL
jgi:membrane peptidoglycan carboxypeptidase